VGDVANGKLQKILIFGTKRQARGTRFVAAVCAYTARPIMSDTQEHFSMPESLRIQYAIGFSTGNSSTTIYGSTLAPIAENPTS
jgi:hypothetical protein